MSEAQKETRESAKENKPADAEDGFDFGSGFDKFATNNDGNQIGTGGADAFDFGGVIG